MKAESIVSLPILEMLSSETQRLRRGALGFLHLPIELIVCAVGVVTCSGISTLLLLAHLLEAGDGVVTVHDVYAGINRYFTHVASKFDVRAAYVNCTDLDRVRASLTQNIKVKNSNLKSWTKLMKLLWKC